MASSNIRTITVKGYPWGESSFETVQHVYVPDGAVAVKQEIPLPALMPVPEEIREAFGRQEIIAGGDIGDF